MEKTPGPTSSKSSKFSCSLIDKFFYRFKMNRYSSHSSITESQQSTEYPSSSSHKQHEECFNDYQCSKITPEDLQQFCEQLGNFFKYVRNIQDLTYVTYDYPR
jgi:hypothetical protein